MSDGFSPLSVHETLDVEGWLDDAHGPGAYAIRLDVPASAEQAHRAWLRHYDAVPEGKALEQLAAAGRVAYVGASGDVYDRLMDHAEGAVRQTALLSVFSPAEVVTIWPSDSPFEDENRLAYCLRDEGWTCWVDGEVV
jgi:hypothetical protein